MECFKLKKELGFPIVGLGTGGIGGKGVYDEKPDYSRDDFYVSALNKAFDMGYRLIDTAEFYGGGHTEELVGQALKNFSREEFFLVSKIWHTHLRRNDFVRSVEGSLQRLQLKHIDLCLIHWPNPLVPIKETLNALEYLIDAGKVRYMGVSNFCLPQLKNAMESAGIHEIVADELKYSIMDRRIEEELLDFTMKNNIQVIAYTPLEKGKITMPLLEDLAKKYSKTISQIALNYLICKGAIPVPKAVKNEHLQENLGSLGWSLSEADIEKINLTPLRKKDIKRISIPSNEDLERLGIRDRDKHSNRGSMKTNM